MKSIEEEEKKPPAKRSRNAPAAEDTASNQNEMYPTTAHITILDEAMQSSISRYMDIYDWGNVQKTSKLFSSWPKPPPPKIDYHLIRFCITDLRNGSYCGVAKTLNSVKDAFKYIYNREEANSRDNYSYCYLAFEFIYIRDCNEPAIPLIQYYGGTSATETCLEDLSKIHPCGKKNFGVQGVQERLPKSSAIKSMMKMDVNLWVWPQPHENDLHRWHDGLLFDDDKHIAAFVWLDGIEPSQDMDLKKLFFARQIDEEGDWDAPNEEIWIHNYEGSKRNKCPHGSNFTLGPGGTWSICNEKTIFWD